MNSPQHRKSRVRLPGLGALTLGLLQLAGPPFASAVPVSQQNVAKAVETWVRHVTAEARPDAVVERTEPYVEKGVTMAYVAHLANGGYCLAGADSLVLPVYFYCPKGTYNPRNPELRWMLRDTAERQRTLQSAAIKGGAAAESLQAELSRRARLWEDLASGKAPAGGGARPLGQPVPRGGTAPKGGPVPQGNPTGPVSMSVPLTSQWSQSQPFDDDCPTLPAGQTPTGANLTDVGCVATATSQLMYYWRWPDSGVGSGSKTYTYDGTSTPLTTPLASNPGIPSSFADNLSWANGVLTMKGWWDGSVLGVAQGFNSSDKAYQDALNTLYGRLTAHTKALTADFTVPINWSAMQDTYTNADAVPVNASETAVAQLCAEVGVAVLMNYGLDGSSTGNDQIPPALVNNFRYDPAAGDFIGPDTNQMVVDIQWLRPCFLSGWRTSDGAAHVWLAYGYNMGTSPWQFKMNLGWGPGSSGWYSFEDAPTGQPNNSNNLTNGMSAATGYAPLKVVGFVGASTPGDGSPNSPYQNIEQAIANAPDNATLIFQAGTVIKLPSVPLTINRPLTLKGYLVTITH